MALALEKCCVDHKLSFLSLGGTSPETSNTFLSQRNFISDLAASLKYTSFTIAWQPEWDFFEAKRLAEEIFRIAELTDGEANFRFGVSFNCKPGIPYFPAAEAPHFPSSTDVSNTTNLVSFAIGTENNQLLYKAFSTAAAKAKAKAADDHHQNKIQNRSSAAALTYAQQELQKLLHNALEPIENIAQTLRTDPSSQVKTANYLGIDTSIAPGLDETTTITAAFEKLPLLKEFGDSGTLAITERITHALQSVPVTRTGYCGLMLPVCEDQGLAQAITDGKISIQNLLQYSAVCGVGLDTVPVPGPGSKTTAEEREVLVCKAAAVLLDVAALSQRLGGKQLSVRLLPVVGGVPGEETRYTSPYLVDSVVMSL